MKISPHNLLNQFLWDFFTRAGLLAFKSHIGGYGFVASFSSSLLLMMKEYYLNKNVWTWAREQSGKGVQFHYYSSMSRRHLAARDECKLIYWFLILKVEGKTGYVRETG